MNKKNLTIILMCIYSFLSSQNISYPTTQKKPVKDNYFGKEVIDNYRWLENDLSEETAQWVSAQNKVTFSYLSKIPFRDKIKSRMEKLWNFERISAPFKEGNYTYFYKNNGLQNQSVLYRIDKNGKEEIFLDPNTFAKDGSSSLAGIEFSKDGSLAAYLVSDAGSDWTKIYIIDTETKKQLENPIIDVKFSGVSWYKNKGFYYSSYDKPKGSELSAKTDQHKLYFHELGTSQKKDLVIYGDKQKKRYVSGGVTEDEKYLIISAANTTYGNELYLIDLSNENKEPITINDDASCSSYVIDNQNTKLFIVTDYKAPNQKMVTVDAKNPSRENWIDFIPETENVLTPSTGGGYIFANYMKDAISQVKQYDYDGKFLRDIKLPGPGSAGGFGGKKSETTLYFSFTNYTTPRTIYSLNPKDGSFKVYQKPKIDFNSDLYESKQVFYESKDGTKIPMIITYKKGIERNSKNPTILYGYGGFSVSLTPSFSVDNAVWLENGGIYAVANLRGGGEYGKSWHEAGIQTNKQNVFDDFIAAAEYLIKEQYTSSSFLAINGGSNGGLLVGAVMTQKPDLMKVAIPEVGVLDMLRYHTFTAGAGWAYDYGTAQDNLEMFTYLFNYSPVHNVKENITYPATLITTGDHDDRVVPAHSFKFAAELQAKNPNNKNPLLIRIETNAGHGAGKPVSKIIEEATDIQSFCLYNMGIKL